MVTRRGRRAWEELSWHVVNGPIRAVTDMTIAMSVPRAVLWGSVASAGQGYELTDEDRKMACAHYGARIP
jgi:hypothetical protein